MTSSEAVERYMHCKLSPLYLSARPDLRAVIIADTEKMLSRMDPRRAMFLKLRALGLTFSVIADVLNLCERQVCRIAKEIENGNAEGISQAAMQQASAPGGGRKHRRACFFAWSDAASAGKRIQRPGL